jgi:hypothetical protein
MVASPPQVNAFLLCDQAFQQAQSGKWCIIGTFGVIWARELPCTHAPLTVFIGLGDFSGDALVQVTIRDDESRVVYAVRGQIPKIPMGMVELAFPFPPVRFEKEGTYTAELLAGGELLSVRSFSVRKVAMPEVPPGAQPPAAPGS